MTQEQKQLLLKVLCEMLPYGVICQLSNKDADVSIIEKLGLGGLEHFIVGSMYVKPYLRPMSSMTEEEKNELSCLFGGIPDEDYIYKPYTDISYSMFGEVIDWLNEHHLDYRGLIHIGLALEATKDMYKTE